MRRKRKWISLKSMLIALTAACLFLVNTLPVLAVENSGASGSQVTIADAKKGVLQVQLVYKDQSGKVHVLNHGSGFLIGASDGGQTVITNYHVVSLDSESVAYYSEIYGVDFSNVNAVEVYPRVVVRSDVTVDASLAKFSENGDFAILNLADPIYGRTTLKLADSAAVVDGQEVYALGFPEANNLEDTTSIYSSEDVTLTKGIVSKSTQFAGISFLTHDATISAGNSGGPLVDETGNVIGVNTAYAGLVDESTTYSYAIAINEIKAVLDDLGVVYESSDESVSEPEPESEIIEQEETAEQEETVEPEPVLETEPEPETEKDSGLSMTIIIGIVIAAAAVVVIIAVIAVTGKKKRSNTIPPINGGNGSASVRPAPAPVPDDFRTQPQQPTPPPYMGTMVADSGAGETSVLIKGAGETSVLGRSMQPGASLIRKKNGETAMIAKPFYSIGKERAKVDFCIPDNNSVSRKHADIICKGGIYYIVDNNSTNYTFINGNKINPGQEVRLNSGDKIKLADEEFEFRQ